MLLHRALELDPSAPGTHARLFARTGLAPRDPVPNATAEAEELVRAHPYDPWTSLMAARVAPSRAVAIAHLRWVLVMADLNRAAARSAVRELERLDPETPRVVPVHLLADETVRAHPGWRFRLRLELKALSEVVDPALQTVFIPFTLREFDGSNVGADLSAISAAGLAALGRPPARGIIAVVTERRPPPRRRPARLGQAEFLGRRTTVRLVPDELPSRVLAHEVLHLFGAVHLADRVDSMMNPDGGEWILREPNAAILRETRMRRFGPGGIDANVLPFVDVDATAEAYLAIIRTNLALRRADAQEILRETVSPRARAQRLRKVVQLDPHMGDVCDFTARLLVVAERPEGAVELFELAARLHGLRSSKGRDSLQRAAAVKETLDR